MFSCKCCGSGRLIPILHNRKDYEYKIERKLNYLKCMNCFYVFASPVPDIEEIKTFYKKYTTHESYDPSFFSKVVSVLSLRFRKKYIRKLFGNEKVEELNILDFGTGNGEFLSVLSGLGVCNVYGYDFDQQAVDYAIKKGFKCYSNLEDVKNIKFDYIFMNHVVEHLADPKLIVSNLISMLAVNGKIVIRTPNTTSLLAVVFKERWRGWETPRHLALFNKNSLCLFDELKPGFKVKNITTSNLMFIGMYAGSLNNLMPNKSLRKSFLKVFSLLLLMYAIVANVINKDIGEELVFEISN